MAIVGALLLPDETIKEDIINCNNSERLSSETSGNFCFLNGLRNETSLKVLNPITLKMVRHNGGPVQKAARQVICFYNSHQGGI